MTHVSEAFVVTRGRSQLVGERWSGGPPVVVFLHAGVADRRSWRTTVAALAGRVTAVSYDRRGHGDSAPSTEPFTHLADLVALLDDVADGPVWLVASSMGGGLALDAALEAPEKVAGMVLIAPAVSGAPEPDVDADTLRLLELVSRAASSDDLDAANRWETSLWLDGPAGPEGRVGGDARALALEMNATILGHDVPEDTGAGGVDAWSRLAEVEIPTTVACGDLDVPLLVAQSAELARLLPRGRHHVLHGTAHLPFLEEPATVAALVSAALPTG
jgi:pimeloyl-ACP methyl ester carboxylesterase